MKLLTLCGSLRVRSSNGAILRAYARLVADHADVEHYAGIASLPHFNPDDDHEHVAREVGALRHCVQAADAVVISTPEYAHALPGAFKNALDWLVSDPAFDGKPVVILHAARGSTWAYDSLVEVLSTMSARIIVAACAQLPLGSNSIDEDAILARTDLRAQLVASLTALQQALSRE